MGVKEWLNRGYKLDREINALITAREKVLELTCRTASGNTSDKVQTSRKNTSENWYIEYADYSREIDNQIDKLIRIKREIQNAINRVSDSTLCTLLIERYINFKTWEQIAVDMNYSLRGVHNLHHKALQKCALFCTIEK